MNKSLVSVIIPCYNQSHYLSEALQSVLDQVYDKWECIIVNDGSPDNTDEIAKEWIDKDTRFKYICKENEGLSSARNAGILIAEGEFILPLDADDKIAPQYIELALKAFEEDSTLTVVYCQAEKFGTEKGLWNLSTFSLNRLAYENMIFCSALFRKSDWELVGGYDPQMLYGLEDWEFWIAILKNGGQVKCLDKIGFYYRIKLNSMVKQLDDNKINYLHKYMSIKHADFFVEQLGSFAKLNDTIKKTRNENIKKLQSEKFVFDVFCKTFLGFSIFGLYKNKKI